jgi:hypothetical protein
MRAGDLDGARQVLAPLDAARYATPVREIARRLLAQIDSRASRSAGRGITSRVAASDEQRTEGSLHAIACAAGAAVIFELHVSGADGKPAPATFTAAKLEDVQLVSHRDDFTGSIGCGPLKEPMPVRVSWTPADGARRAVAIEFLPKRSPASPR